MFLAAIALSALLERCAPNAGPRTMTAIVSVESGANPLAIHDNTTGRSFTPQTVTSATQIAELLIAAGHSVDLGLVQINSANLARLHMRVHDAFDPCANLHGGATILAAAYARAADSVGPGLFALRRAIGAYNTGSIYAGDAYINRILIAAGLPAQNDRPLPDLQAPAVLVRRFAPPVALAPTAAPKPVARTQPAPPPAPTPTPQPTVDPYGSTIIVTSVAPAPAATPAP